MSTSLFQRQRYGRSVFLHDRKAVAHVVIKYGRISGQMTLIGAEEPASHHCHVCKKTMALRRGADASRSDFPQNPGNTQNICGFPPGFLSHFRLAANRFPPNQNAGNRDICQAPPAVQKAFNQTDRCGSHRIVIRQQGCERGLQIFENIPIFAGDDGDIRRNPQPHFSQFLTNRQTGVAGNDDECGCSPAQQFPAPSMKRTVVRIGDQPFRIINSRCGKHFPEMFSGSLQQSMFFFSGALQK